MLPLLQTLLLYLREEEAFLEAYLRRIVEERPAAEVPAAAPVTEPAPAPVPRTPDGT